MQIITLGPEGTYSHEAVNKFFPEYKIGFASRIDEVISIVEEGGVKGLVPIKNSTIGLIHETIDKLSSSKIQIEKEVVLEINHCIASKTKISFEEIKNIYSHHHAISQCNNFINTNISQAFINYTRSTAEASDIVANKDDKYSVAICSELVASKNNLIILESNIQDKKDNKTTFALICR